MFPLIQISRHIQNPTQYLWWTVLYRSLCKHNIFRSLVYWERQHIQNLKDIQNPVKHLRWRIYPEPYKTLAYSEL